MERESINNTTSSKTARSQSRPSTSDPLMLILLIVLCIFLPPVAIAVYSGITNWFWIDLVLFILGIGGLFLFPLAGLAALVAVIIAFLVVFDVI